MLYLFARSISMSAKRNYHKVTYVPDQHLSWQNKPKYVGGLDSLLSPKVNKKEFDHLVISNGLSGLLDYEKKDREVVEANKAQIVGLTEILNQNKNIVKLNLPRLRVINQTQDFINPFFDQLKSRESILNIRLEIDWGLFSERDKALFVEKIASSRAFSEVTFHSNQDLIPDPVANSLHNVIVNSIYDLVLTFKHTLFKKNQISGLANAFKNQEDIDTLIEIEVDNDHWDRYIFYKQGVRKIVSEQTGETTEWLSFEDYEESLAVDPVVYRKNRLKD